MGGARDTPSSTSTTKDAAIAGGLDDVAVVVSCIDQPERGLLHAAVKRGLLYTDITPRLTELGRGAGYERIHTAAKASVRESSWELGFAVLP